MKTKLLICGATGFIGRNLTAHFAKNLDYDVHAVYFSRQPFECKNVTWHHADLRNPYIIDGIMADVDVVLQAAATTSGSKDIVTRPYVHVTDNAVMNAYLFRAAMEHNVEHMVFFSCTVMYPSSELPLKENDFDANQPLNPRYFGVGNTKLYIEKMCEFYSGISDTRYTAIRHSNIYGPHDKFDLERSHVFGATVTKVMTAEDKVTVWGMGEESRDLLYVDDLVRFVELALKKQNEKFRIYNCGYGSAIKIKTLVQKIIEYSGKKLKIEHDLSKPTIPTALCLNCGLAKKELGWMPEISLETGIARTIDFWKSHCNVFESVEKTNELL